jgi:hypothetical protein
MGDWQKHDKIPPNHLIIYWAFDLKELEDEFGYVYGDPVNEKVVQAFEESLQIGLGDIEYSDLRVFVGDIEGYYVIGVSGIANTIVISFINRKLESVPGFQFMSFGSIPRFPLVPAFRFYGGNMIVYSDDSMSGKVIKDDGDYYGTSLELIYMEAIIGDFP